MIPITNEYTAGFFDAEGSIWLGPSGSGGTVLRATVTQKDPTILSALQNTYGGSVNPCGNGVFRLNVNTFQAEAFLEEVLQHLVIKHRDADRALALWRERHTLGAAQVGKMWKGRDRVYHVEAPRLPDAYTAGLFDGDGWFKYYTQVRLCAGISSKCEAVLESVRKEFLGKVYIYEGTKGVYQWRVWTLQAKRFFDAIRPFSYKLAS